MRSVAELAAAANEAAAESSRPGAPFLSIDSGVATLRDWCDWNDPNGEWLDAESRLEEAWDAIETMLFDDSGESNDRQVREP